MRAVFLVAALLQLAFLARAIRPGATRPRQGTEIDGASLLAAAPKNATKPKVEAQPEVEAAEKARSSLAGAKKRLLPSKCECKFEDFCTCDGILGYLDCISKKCASEDCDCPHNQFEASCVNVGNMCGEELEFGCSNDQATCRGHYHQLSDSVVGITVDTDSLSKRSYCGPFGKCQGTVDARVQLHHVPEGESMVVQCELQRYEGAKEVDGKGWSKCEAEVDGNGEAVCSMPMPHSLKPGASLEGSCVAAALGKTRFKSHRLVTRTKQAWWQVSNKYQPPAAASGAGREKGKPKKDPADTRSGAAGRTTGGALAGLAGLLIVLITSP